MPKDKLTKKEIEALEVKIKTDQSRPVRENERRVRISGSFKDAVKRIAKIPPISSEDLSKWVKDQRRSK